MPQHDYVIDNAAGAVVRSDLNDALAALQSSNSGSTAPTATRGGMFWLDTSVTPPLIKVRNNADSAWITLGELDTTFKLDGTSASGRALMNTTSATGIIAQTGATAFAKRSIAAGNGVTVTNGSGVSGNPTVAADYASQAQAEAGTDTAKAMNALRTKQAIDAQEKQVGVGQTWQDVSASRQGNNTAYQNTTGKPIVVNINDNPGVGHTVEASSDGSTWVVVGFVGGNAGINSTSVMIPDQHYYRYSRSVGLGGMEYWAELR